MLNIQIDVYNYKYECLGSTSVSYVGCKLQTHINGPHCNRIAFLKKCKQNLFSINDNSTHHKNNSKIFHF